jgi:hypothetical protein
MSGGRSPRTRVVSHRGYTPRVRPVGRGALGVGIVGLGWALSIGFVSIGINAVGWIAIGVNAAGFIALGLVNSAGVFSFGGVNAVGGWGGGGVNTGTSGPFGVGVCAITVVLLLVARVRTWPRGDAQELVPLAAAADSEGSWARARLMRAAGDVITLRDDETELRALAADEFIARCAMLGHGAPVRVRLRRVADRSECAGYRDPANVVEEIVDIADGRRAGWPRRAFGDQIGIQLAFACVGLVAAAVSLVVWR